MDIFSCLATFCFAGFACCLIGAITWVMFGRTTSFNVVWGIITAVALIFNITGYFVFSLPKDMMVYAGSVFIWSLLIFWQCFWPEPKHRFPDGSEF